MHGAYNRKIDEAKEEITECDPYISTVLAEAGAIAGMALFGTRPGKVRITGQQYEEKMEEIKKLSAEFQNRCGCNAK